MKTTQTDTYRLTKDAIYDESGKKHTVYGIRVTGPAGDAVRSFPDVFFDKQKAKRFVTRCNKNALSPVHLADVVEDILDEQYAVK